MNDGTIVASGIITTIALVIIIMTVIDRLAGYMEGRRQEKQRMKDDIVYIHTQLNEIRSFMREISETKQK